MFGDESKKPEPIEDAPRQPEGENTVGDEATDTSSPDLGQIRASLKRNLVKMSAKSGGTLNEGDLKEDVDLYDAGYVDSMTASEFLILAEKEYGIRLPDWLIGGQENTLKSLASYIKSQLTLKSK